MTNNITDNIVILKSVPKPEVEENNNIVEITFHDGLVELIDSDAFAFTEDMPGFIAFWKEDPYEMVALIASSSIKKLRIIEKVDG